MNVTQAQMFLLVYAVTVTTLVLAVRRRTRSQLVIILVTLGVSIAAEQLFLRQMMGHPDSPLASHAAEFIEGTELGSMNLRSEPASTRASRTSIAGASTVRRQVAKSKRVVNQPG